MFLETCYLCKAELHPFMTTPTLELPDRTLEECCEECANREFPGWDDEEEDEVYE